MFLIKSGEKKRFAEYIEKHQLHEVLRLLRLKKAGVFMEVMKTTLVEQTAYPQLNTLQDDRNVTAYVEDINAIIKAKAYERLYYSLARKGDILASTVGRGLGFSSSVIALKKAVASQMVSPEPLHILVLTDDALVREIITENVSRLAPIVSLYGGGRDLVVERGGGKVMQGLLPRADKGICIAHEFKEGKDMERFLSAMDKGVVVSEKLKKEFTARVSVLAFAEPRGLRLLTRSLDVLRRQVPFPEEVLSRFHLIFVLEKKDRMGGSRRILEEDVDLLKGYARFCTELPVLFDERYAAMVEKFVSFVKKDEHHFVADASGRVAFGVKRLASARAMLHIREHLLEEDVKDAMEIMRESLYNIGDG